MVIYEMKSVMNSLHLVAVSSIRIRVRVVLSTILKKVVQNEQRPGPSSAVVKLELW